MTTSQRPADDTEMPSRSTSPSLWITGGEAVDNPVDNGDSKQGVSKRVQALPFGGGSAPTRGPEGASSEGYIDRRSIPRGSAPLERPEGIKNHPGCVLGASFEDTVPDLWPGMDRSTRTADAWRILWHLTADGPVRWATAVAVMAEAHPTLARKTVALIPYKAVAARLLTKRGGYSHKTGRDTRTVERRHPDPTEHQ